MPIEVEYAHAEVYRSKLEQKYSFEGVLVTNVLFVEKRTFVSRLYPQEFIINFIGGSVYTKTKKTNKKRKEKCP